jgi:ATP-dependent 26S proteasome regulatory subunit
LRTQKTILWNIRFNISQAVYLLSHKKIYSSQPELNNNWTKVSYKRGRLTQEETEREAKHTTESKHWLNQTSTSSHYMALLEEESEDKQQKARPENMLKPPPIYITDVTNISPLIQLLKQIAKQQLKPSHTIRLKFSLKSDSYRTITKALAEKSTEFHAYKLREERSYREELKICTSYSILKKSKLKLRN